jgi:U3 small nucleolar RNA-associated protein 25
MVKLKYNLKLQQITPSILATFQESHPSPSTILNTTLDLASSYKDLFLHGMDGEADGSSSKKGNALYGNEAEDVRSAIMMHAVNHVMK